MTCNWYEIFQFFREPDNVAMFKKVLNDDSHLESINDKRAASILLQMV